MTLARTPKPIEYVTTWDGKRLEDMTRGELEAALVEAWNMQQQAIDARDIEIGMRLAAIQALTEENKALKDQLEHGNPNPGGNPGGGPP